MSGEGVFHARLAVDEAPGGACEISIGAGALARASGSSLRPWLAGRTVFVLSTLRLRELHGEALVSLGEGAARVVDLEVPDGEEAKTVEHAAALWRRMVASGGKRDSRLITFGGGTVGDLGGFVASCFLRGIEYVQVPTTLLAQVDAAIGGKTAIDLEEGKNTVGQFHHPAQVISDTELLTTLPRGELRSGLVEVVKMAALLDPDLLARVEQNLDALLAADAVELAPVVAGATNAKCRVVERDPREGSYRRILNFGHTLGHAIEAAGGYSGLRHGEAVAYGMLFACRLASRRGLDPNLGRRLVKLLERFELPPLPSADPETLVRFISRDKKATEAGVTWVLPTAVGEGFRGEVIDSREIVEELEVFLEDPMSDRTFGL